MSSHKRDYKEKGKGDGRGSGIHLRAFNMPGTVLNLI